MIFYHWNCRSIFNPCGDSVHKVLVIDSWCNRTCFKGLINFSDLCCAAAKWRKSKKMNFLHASLTSVYQFGNTKRTRLQNNFIFWLWNRSPPHSQINWLWGPVSIERNFYYCVTIVNVKKKNCQARISYFCDKCVIFAIHAIHIL